jgi:signal transduction histidine kinase
MPTPLPSVDLMVEGRDGSAWAFWSGHIAPNRRLQRFANGRWSDGADRLGLPGGMVNGAAIGSDGSLWVALESNDSGGSVVRLRRGEARFVDSGYRVSGTPHVAADRQGQVWIWDDAGLAMLAGPGGRPPATAARFPDIPRARYPHLAFDAAGGIWGTTGTAGIFTILGPQAGFTKPSHFGAGQGLTSDKVAALFIDREGSIWAGGVEGLDQFRRASVLHEPLIPFVLADGAAMAQGREGSVYIATSGGLFVIAPRATPRAVMDASDLSAMCPARDRGIWAISSSAIVRIDGTQRSRPLALPPVAGPVASCAEDRVGRLWLMFGSLALMWHDAAGWHQATDGAREAAGGSYWELTGTPDGRIAFTQRAKLVRMRGASRSEADLGRFNIGSFSLFEGAGQDMFLASPRGLARLRSGRMHVLSTERLPWIGRLKSIVQTPQGQSWLVGDNEISVVASADLARAFEHPDAGLARRLFDIRDGLRSGPINGMVGPVAAMGGDGRAWFLTQSGAFFIDPANITRNPVPPGVAIRWLAAGGGRYRDPARLVLPPGTRSLDIAYAGLSLAVPQRVQFRYRLDGVDEDWVDPGSRRLASYANLAPGHYRFRVIASNNDGVWNNSGAALEFEIRPTFVESWPFRIMCGLLLLCLLWLAYRVRLRAVANRIRMRMADRLDERERIARDLHDTLLQSVQSLTLRFQLVVDELPIGQRARPGLEAAIDRADQVIAEGRDSVKALRLPRDEDDIEDILRGLVAEQGFDPAMAVSIEAVGTPRALEPLALAEIARIASEAIFNIRRHAHATRVAIELRYHAGFAISFVDNGVGIDPALIDQGGRTGHFGLPGMSERAKKLNGELTVRRIDEGGTQVLLTVPGRIAYGAGRRWRFLPW